ncbi:MAG TPA: four helix bundle protein [Chitinophagaceae bacterium]|nr:four helix bundle protein [Chitinophagaceae bacterium]
MDSGELLNRLKQFAYRVVKLTKHLPDFPESQIIRGQILRSSFSAAANYRSACSAYSKKSFSAKLGISLEELDESVFWLEVIADLGFFKQEVLAGLTDEGGQLCRIIAQSIITSKKKQSATS